MMEFLGLPGETALPMVTGMFLNFYAALGIIIALDLTAWQLTILAVMLTCCHELVIETAVIKKTGIRAWPVVMLRLATAFCAGAGMNFFHNLMR